MMSAAGFVDVKIEAKEHAPEIIKDWMPGSGAEKYITSVYVTATKPGDSSPKCDDARREEPAPCCVMPPMGAGGCGPGV